MIRGILTSGAAMRPALEAQSILANNLANATASGFRQDRIAFERVLTPPETAAPGEPAADAPQLRAALDSRPGPYEVTQGPLDLAIEGDGYFVVATPDGDRFTRAGQFQLTQEGALVTSQGFPVLSSGGPLTLPTASGLLVTRSGEIRDAQQTYGRLRIVTFDPQAPSGLTHVGGGLLAASAEPIDAPDARVLQGVLEGPNVEPLQAMVEMVTLLRHFEMNEKALHSQDESLGTLLEWARS
jgi:flagellar basal-body rod protein FlgF